MENINIDEFEGYLKKIIFPAGKSHILESAKNTDAPEKILVVLSEIPDMEYSSTVELKRRPGVIPTCSL